MFRIGLRFTGDDEYWVVGFPIKNEHFVHNNALLHNDSLEQMIYLIIRLNFFFFFQFTVTRTMHDTHAQTQYFVCRQTNTIK